MTIAINFPPVVSQEPDLLREDAVPSKTPKQARTMRAAAHDKAFADKLDIPPKVAKEFVKADKAQKVKRK